MSFSPLLPSVEKVCLAFPLPASSATSLALSWLAEQAAGAGIHVAFAATEESELERERGGGEEVREGQ